MFGKRPDDRPPLDQAAASGLKPGSWASVEALAMLAVEAKDRPEAAGLCASAQAAARGLSSGSWESVRALTWLARAERELHGG